MLTDTMMLQMATAVARWFELAGIAAIVGGSLIAMAKFAWACLHAHPPELVEARHAPIPVFRRNLGRSILIGLELLVAADIIRTVAVEPTMGSVLVLGLIVLIRTFLSMSLEVEIEGTWPWHRAEKRKGPPPGDGPSSDS